MLVAAFGMVAVGVGDDRTFDRAPGVDVEIPGGAVQTFGAGDNKVHVCYQIWRGLLAMRMARGEKFYRFLKDK